MSRISTRSFAPLDTLRRTARRLQRARRGVAATEFALAAPFYALIMLATADATFYVRTKLKLDTAANGVAQAVTQYHQLYTGDFTQLFNASQLIAGSVAVTGQFGATVISLVSNSGGASKITWQEISPGSTFKSAFGGVGSTAQLPNSYVPPAGVTLVVAETYTTATPWVFSASFMGGSATTTVGSVALFQPRFAALASIAPGNRP